MANEMIPTALRRPARYLARLARQTTDRPLRTIPGGPAAGLRISHRFASARYADGPNELPVQEAVAAALRPGDVFFDIGANVGFFSLIASRIVGPTGAVVAFEPIPAIAGQLESNARANHLNNVSVLRIAVADRDAETTLQTTAHPGGATLTGFGVPGDCIGSIAVQARTLDSLVSSGQVLVPSVIKIDVEGAEAAVFRGAIETLKAHRPVIIYELDAPNAPEMEAKKAEVEELLHLAGYRDSELPQSYGDGHLVRHYVAQGI